MSFRIDLCLCTDIVVQLEFYGVGGGYNRNLGCESHDVFVLPPRLALHISPEELRQPYILRCLLQSVLKQLRMLKSDGTYK